MSLMLRSCCIACLLVLVQGCADTRHDRLLELGFTRNYLDGYQDGCSSRKDAGLTYHDGFRQDPERMAADRKYANGWNDGYEQCYADNAEYY